MKAVWIPKYGKIDVLEVREAAQAHACIEAGQNIGKVVLTP